MPDPAEQSSRRYRTQPNEWWDKLTYTVTTEDAPPVGSSGLPGDIKGRCPIISPFSASEPRQTLPTPPSEPEDMGGEENFPNSPDPYPVGAVIPYREGLLLKSIIEKSNSSIPITEYASFLDPLESGRAYSVPLNMPGELRCSHCGGYKTSAAECYYCRVYNGGVHKRRSDPAITLRMLANLLITRSPLWAEAGETWQQKAREYAEMRESSGGRDDAKD